MPPERLPTTSIEPERACNRQYLSPAARRTHLLPKELLPAPAQQLCQRPDYHLAHWAPLPCAQRDPLPGFPTPPTAAGCECPCFGLIVGLARRRLRSSPGPPQILREALHRIRCRPEPVGRCRHK